MATARTELATAADLGALPAHVRAEIIRGVVVEKASPPAEQRSFGEALKRRLQPFELTELRLGVLFGGKADEAGEARR